MKFGYYETQKMPVTVVDDFFDKPSIDRIWQELIFLNNSPKKLKLPENTGGAYDMVDGEKIYLKDNLAIGLDAVYFDRSMSSILEENRKVWSEEVLIKLESLHCFYRFIRYSNKDSTLVNYYEKSHYYKPHMDEATVTCITFFYQQPKKFSGGDLIIDKHIKVECIPNRMVIFPSILHHEVEETTVSEEFLGKNFGRYSITQLMSINV